MKVFEVQRQDLTKTRIAEEPGADLAGGQVRLRVDLLALTANNVSYAVTGDRLGYWDFFPASEGWGRIPAMGWAEVEASEHPEVQIGGRYYGWFPITDHLILDVEVSRRGMVDAGAHRADHAMVYRTFVESGSDPFYQSGREAEHALLRGLFVTAFLADDFFEDQGFFGSRTTVILSASSKTAIGLAFQAHGRGRGPVIGATSAGNREFVESLGFYDQVVTYDALDAMAVEGDAVLVDMSGNGEVVERCHHILGERLRHSMAVGASHWDAQRSGKDLPGPPPAFFFAPHQVAKRVEEWGPVEYQRRVAESLARFVEGSDRWLTIEPSRGAEATEATYHRLLAGRIDPRRGQIVSMLEDA